MTLTLISVLDILSLPHPCSMILPICESVSKSYQLVTVKRPLGAKGQSGWEASLLIIDDLAVNLTEALRRNVKSSDKLLFVIPLPSPPPQS